MSIWTKEVILEKERKAEETGKIWNSYWDENINEADHLNFFETLIEANKENMLLRGIDQTNDGNWKVYISHMNTILSSGYAVDPNLYTALEKAIESCKKMTEKNQKWFEEIKNKKDALKDFMDF